MHLPQNESSRGAFANSVVKDSLLLTPISALSSVFSFRLFFNDDCSTRLMQFVRIDSSGIGCLLASIETSLACPWGLFVEAKAGLSTNNTSFQLHWHFPLDRNGLVAVVNEF